MERYIVSRIRLDRDRKITDLRWVRVNGDMQVLGDTQDVSVDTVCDAIAAGGLVLARSPGASNGGQLSLGIDQYGDRLIELEDNGSELKSITDLPRF